MSRLPTVLAIAIAAACAGCSEPRAADADHPAPAVDVDVGSGTGTAGTSAWTTVQLMDTAWPGTPMAFATIDLPADWLADGGIAVVPHAAAPAAFEPQSVSPAHDPDAAGAPGSPTQCQAMPLTCLTWSAGRRDGSQGIAILPSATWSVDLPPAGRRVSPPASTVRDALLGLARQRHPDARVIAFAPVVVPAPPAGNETPYPTRWESGRLLVAYDAEGHDIREEWTTVLMISETGTLPGGLRRAMVTGNPPIAVHALAGEFDTLDRERIRVSMTMAPDWWQRLAELTRLREAARQQHTCNQAIHHPRPPGCDGMPTPG